MRIVSTQRGHRAKDPSKKMKSINNKKLNYKKEVASI